LHAHPGSARAAPALAPPAHATKRDAVCATVKKGKKAPYVAIVSAFPAETRPNINSMTFESQVELGGRPFYLGRIGRVRVIVGLVGIGLVNAENTTRAILQGIQRTNPKRELVTSAGRNSQGASVR
jgi:hypothetical protein